MNKYVALNMLIEHQGQIVVAVLKEDAERVVQMHGEGTLPTTVGSHNVRCREDVLGFSVRSVRMQAVYLTPIAPESLPAYPPPSPFPFLGAS